MKALFDILARNRLNMAIALLLAILPLLVSSGIVWLVVRHEQQLQLLQPLAWAGIFAVATVFMAFSLVPTTFISLVSGYLMGFGAVLPVFVSYVVAALVSFYSARLVDGGTFVNSLQQHETVRRTFFNLKQKELVVVLLAKISPVLPFTLTNFMLAISGVKLKNYLLGSIIGMVPRSLVAIWVGSQAREMLQLFETGNQVTADKLLVVALVIISVAGLFSVFKKALAKSVAEEAEI